MILHLLHRSFDQISPGLVKGSELADFTRLHIAIDVQIRVRKSFSLDDPCSLDSLAEAFAQFFKGNARDFEVNIDPVQESARYFFW